MRVALAAVALALLAPSPAAADIVLHREDTFTADAGPLRLADYDGDGHLDALTASGATLGAGGGTLRDHVPGGAPAAQVLAPAADFDGDGVLDAAAIRGGVVQVDDGDGTGAFAGAWQPAAHAGFATPVALTATDLNGDGRDDLVVGYQGQTPADPGGVRVFLGAADGTLAESAAVLLAGSTQANAVDWGDLDHDGKKDVVVGSSDSGVLVLRGHGDGTFDAPAGGDTGDVTALYTDDFRDDGFVDDIVFAVSGSGLWERTGTDPTHRLIALPATAITAADLDADGHLDAVMLLPGSVAVLHGTGAGFTAPPATFALPADGTALDTGDLDEDGVDDVAVSVGGTGGFVLRNAPRLVASAASVAFPDTYASVANATRPVAFSNAGAAPAAVSGVSVEGAGFSLVSNRCGGRLAAGASCQVVAGFAPPAATAFSGAVAIASNDPAGALRVPLSGRGAALPPATPVTPPATGRPVNAAATVAAALAKKLARLGLRRLSGRGAATVSFRAPVAGALTLIVGDSKGRRLGSGGQHVSGPTSRTINIVFSKAARKRLRSAKTFTVRVKATFVPRAGATQRGAVKIKLKR